MILLCSRWRKFVILNVLRQVSMLCHFCLFFKLCSWCFEQPSGDSGTWAPRALPEFSITIYIGERKRACFVCLFHHPRSHFIKLLTRSLFFGSCHCSCLGLVTVHNIVRSRRSHDFVRSRFTWAHSLESELSYAAKYFLKHKSYRTECFSKQWICIEHWIWSSTQRTGPISKVV